MAPGRVVYTAMLNERGGIESDLTVMRFAPDAYLLVTGTAQVTRDSDWIRRHVESERVTLTDVTSAYGVLGVMGPKSRDLLQGLTPADLSHAAFPYFTWREIELGCALVRAARLSFVGELGWELYVPVEFACHVYDLLMEAGVAHGLADAGSYALTSLRVEKAYRAWGHDIGPDDTPLQAGLDFAVKLGKPVDFLGRAALVKQRETGLERRLVVLTLEDSAALPLGDEPVLQGDRVVGQVTSAAFGHSVGRAVALGYVRVPAGSTIEALLAEGGFALDIAGEAFSVMVSLKPAWDSESRRLRV